MLIKCVECDDVLDDMEHLYKGKAYCDDYFRAVKKSDKVKSS
jgi:hypothetical protein